MKGINLGESPITTIYIGNNEIKKIYLGDNLIYNKEFISSQNEENE